MANFTKSKLELLIDLANIDHVLDKCERNFLTGPINECNRDPDEFMEHKDVNINYIKTADTKTRAEFLFQALKLIMIDNVTEAKELSYCRKLAFELGFKPAIIDHYARKEMLRVAFDQEVTNWLM